VTRDVAGSVDVAGAREEDPFLLARVDALRRSNAELAEVAAVTAHELKSPLVSALSLLELLALTAAGELTPEQRDLIDRARSRLRGLADRVDGLLHAASSTDGTTPPGGAIGVVADGVGSALPADHGANDSPSRVYEL
jgi:signal transduction histidine kinase